MTKRAEYEATTKREEPRRCEWCRRPMIVTTSIGRPRAYCKQSCRQRAYEARAKAVELGLTENELIVTKHALESLLDQIYVLQAAIEDIDRDLAADDAPKEMRRALEWLLSAARPLTDTPML